MRGSIYACVGHRGHTDDIDRAPKKDAERARKRCLHLLERRRYTEKKLMEKLLRGGYDEETAADALDYVKSFHYVDDEAYARDFIEYRTGSISRGAIRHKLLSRGVERDVIDYVMEETEDEVCEGPLIRNLLAKKHYDPVNMDRSEKQKIFAYILRRGFSPGDIRREMFIYEE